ncbi:MAG: HAD family hydrolase [Alphaproteobacteria bacterium]|nr:HAD family hydrolase [Alphaproteobacteria bacterium]
MMKIINAEKFERSPDAVLFDLDNTVYPYDPAHAAAMNAVRRKVSDMFLISHEQFDDAFDQARGEVKKRLGMTAASCSRLLYFQRMLEIIGLGSQVLLALDFEQTYWRTFIGNAVLFDGVKEFLDDLRLARIPVALVTNLTAQIQFRKIIYFELDGYFDCIVTSEEAGSEKPDCAPFDIAIEKMRVERDRFWMIGDDPVNDIAGARNAIDAVTLQKIHDGVRLGEGEHRPDAVFEDYDCLRKMFRKLQAS